MSVRPLPLLFVALLAACAAGPGHHGTVDGGHPGDAGAMDAAPMDAASVDASNVDAHDGGCTFTSCPTGTTCLGGACVPLVTDAGLEAGVADLGHDLGPADMGRDLGPADMGRDLGPADLGRPDLGPPDLGPAFDAGPACAAPLHIGLYAADTVANHMSVKTFLDATARFASVTIGGPVETSPPPVGPVPTLAELDAYDAVLVWGSGSWDGNAFGDVLADYVDQGHGVVIMVFAERTSSSVGVEGRMLSASYLPYVPGTYMFGPRSLGVVAVPSHPIMAGVATFGGTLVAYHMGPIPAYATLVASFDTGDPLVAVAQPSAGRTVLLGFYPVTPSPMFWDPSTDGAKLIANGLHWSACGN